MQHRWSHQLVAYALVLALVGVQGLLAATTGGPVYINSAGVLTPPVPATAISVVPAGTIDSTNVGAALNELDAKTAQLSIENVLTDPELTIDCQPPGSIVQNVDPELGTPRTFMCLPDGDNEPRYTLLPRSQQQVYTYGEAGLLDVPPERPDLFWPQQAVGGARTDRWGEGGEIHTRCRDNTDAPCHPDPVVIWFDRAADVYGETDDAPSTLALLESRENTAGTTVRTWYNANGTAVLSHSTAANQGVRLLDPGTRPTCEAATRGMRWPEFGATNVADTDEVCVKLADNSYAWTNRLVEMLHGGSTTALPCAVSPNNNYLSFAGGPQTTAVANASSPVLRAGTVTRLDARFSGNVDGGHSIVVTLFKNEASTAMTCTVGAGTKTCSTTSNPITFAIGDLIEVHLSCSGSTTAQGAPKVVALYE